MIRQKGFIPKFEAENQANASDPRALSDADLKQCLH